MGLLSKVKAVSGQLKNRLASSAGALRAAASRSPIARNVVGVVGTGAKLTGKVGGVVARAAFGGKIRTAVTLGTIGIAAVRRIGKRREEAKATLDSQAGRAALSGGAALAAQRKTPLALRIAKGAAVVGAAGVGLFAAEKIAERLGVRGGAGFIGRRGRRRAARRRAARRRRARPLRRRAARRMTALQRMYFGKRRGRGVPRTLRYRAKRGRRGTGVSKTELRHIIAEIRRGERD